MCLSAPVNTHEAFRKSTVGPKCSVKYRQFDALGVTYRCTKYHK